MIDSIPSPAESGFGIGPLEVHVYGLMYAVAVVVAVLITVRRWEAKGGSRELVYDVALWAFPAGLVGGRLYFDLTSSNLVPPHWWGPLAVWDGGMGIWGGIALGSAVGLWRLRRHGVPPGPFMDAVAPALLVGQAIGRIGNYFNQELFGGPTNLPWGLHISLAHRPPGYEAFATFHPTFLYELIFNLGLAAFLVWLGHHRRIRPPGLFALYVAGYSAFRIFEESLRVDPAHYIYGLRLNFYVACALTVAGLAWFAASQRQPRRDKQGSSRARTLSLIAAGTAALALAGCGQGAARAATGPPEGAGESPDLGRVGRTALVAAAATNPGAYRVVGNGLNLLDNWLRSNSANLEASAARSAEAASAPAEPGEEDPSAIPPASAGTNGTVVPPLPGGSSAPLVVHSLSSTGGDESGPTTTLINGIALAPPSAPDPIKGAINAANTISATPYIWGGGHASFFARGYDCSGTVSFALFGAGFLSSPLASGNLESWGVPGPGRWLTVYANAGHAYAVIAGLRWDTVGDAKGSGPRWHSNVADESAGFVARHYPGY